MKTIWKFHLAVTQEQPLAMPEGSEILTVQLQGDALVLWAKVNDARPTVERIFHVYGTGHPVHGVAELEYIATVQVGAIVLHIFERV